MVWCQSSFGRKRQGNAGGQRTQGWDDLRFHSKLVLEAAGEVRNVATAVLSNIRSIANRVEHVTTDMRKDETDAEKQLANELLSNKRKDNYAKEEAERKEKEALEKEKQNKLKIETDENNFSKTVAQEMLDKMNADNGNTRNFYELSSDLNIDETGKKYFDVVAKDIPF